MEHGAASEENESIGALPQTGEASGYLILDTRCLIQDTIIRIYTTSYPASGIQQHFAYVEP